MSSALRTRNIFDPASQDPYKISRNKLELFVRCPRCFYLDRRLGVSQPSQPGYTLNTAVDALLKREFDAYRRSSTVPPLLQEAGMDLVPFAHPSLDEWRDTTRGLRFHHVESNFILTGALDDIWVDREGLLSVVDYKSTSTDGRVSLDGSWKDSYKRQVEVYQWLLRRNGFRVSDEAFFVYVNADRSRDSFEGTLKFSTSLLRHTGDDGWIDDGLREARLCLERSQPPLASATCEWCGYRKAARSVEGEW